MQGEKRSSPASQPDHQPFQTRMLDGPQPGDRHRWGSRAPFGTSLLPSLPPFSFFLSCCRCSSSVGPVYGAPGPPGSASRPHGCEPPPTWLESSPRSRCTMPWLLPSVSLSTSSSESSRRDDEPVEESEEVDSLRDCRCSEPPVLSQPPSACAGGASGLPCDSSLSSAVTVRRGMTGGSTPLGGRQPRLAGSGSCRAAAAATAAQRASKRERSSPTLSRVARLSSGLLCSAARGSALGSAAGARRAEPQGWRPGACMRERRARRAAGETSLLLSLRPPLAARRRGSCPARPPRAALTHPQPVTAPAAPAPGPRGLAEPSRPPPPRSASAPRGGASRAPPRGTPAPRPPRPFLAAASALLVSLSLERPPLLRGCFSARLSALTSARAAACSNGRRLAPTALQRSPAPQARRLRGVDEPRPEPPAGRLRSPFQSLSLPVPGRGAWHSAPGSSAAAWHVPGGAAHEGWLPGSAAFLKKPELCVCLSALCCRAVLKRLSQAPGCWCAPLSFSE